MKEYLDRFRGWQGWKTIAALWGKLWNVTIHWHGWKAFAAFWKKIWDVVICWKGWKVIFCLPAWSVLVLCIACGTGLVWVFLHGLENRIPAFFLYGLSAYALAALCITLPTAVRDIRGWLKQHPRLADAKFRFDLELYFEQFINFAYGIFKTVSGVIVGSAWIGCDGIYNLAQALIQLFQILKRKKSGTLEQQWKSYRICGWLVFLMHLTLTGIVFQMVNWNRAEESGEIQIIATAAFAFYKIINSFVDLARDRKHIHPIDSSVRMLEMTQAVFAMFSLQASMLHTFGTGESWEHWLNVVFGCVVCLSVSATGIYMLLRGNREIKKIRELENGE